MITSITVMVLGFLGTCAIVYKVFNPTTVDSHVIVPNGDQVVMFVTANEVEAALKGLRPWFRIVSIDNDGGLYTIVIEIEEKPIE